tara:strand:- start:1356 stop:1712 length:357 start_codon:yes stop_codon:yes gene_type:complete
VATAAIAAVFTIHMAVNNDYQAGMIDSHPNNPPPLPIQKSLYQEIEESDDKYFIEDIQDVRLYSEDEPDQVQKVGVPVSFYSMPVMKFNVRYERASFFRSAPRCDLPTSRSWDSTELR